MTQYLSDKSAGNGPTPVHGFAVTAQHMHAKAYLPTALAVGDTILLGFLPPGAVVTNAMLKSDQLDTGNAPTLALNFGDNGYSYMLNGVLTPVAADLQRYFSAATIGRAAAGSDANVAPTPNPHCRMFKNLSNQKVALVATVTAAAQTFQPGVLESCVTYFVEE